MFKVEKIASSGQFAALSINSYGESLQELFDDGFSPVSVSSLAELRMDLGAYHEVSWTGSRTTDFFIYNQGKYYLAHTKPFDLRNIAVLRQLTSFNETSFEMPFMKDLLLNAVEIPTEDIAIPLNSFTSHPVTSYLFGDTKERYAEWLKAEGIPVFPLALPPYSLVRNGGSFMRPLIMRCTDNWSGIITANADSHSLYGFRGRAANYSKEFLSEESIEREYLDGFTKFISLEDRDYTVNELHSLTVDSEYSALFNPLMRFARNKKRSTIPASYDTFSG